MQLATLILYSALLVGLGLWIGRRVGGTGDFFVAGRKLSPLLLFSTVLAANIGAGSTVGAAGLGYRNGLASWWWVGCAGIGTLLLAFWIGPRLWRIAREHELLTVGDYLELRYGPSVRATIAILLWMGTLAILAGQLIAMSWILYVVAGVPKAVGCLIGGGVMTAYFAAGGLLTSAYVNLVQLVVMVGGFLVALPWAMMRAGGWEKVVAAAPAASPDYLHFWSGGASGLIYLTLLVPAFMISPGLLQKIYGARNESAIRWGVGLSGCALLLFAAVPPLFGMIARVYQPALENPEMALPTVLVAGLPLVFGTLGLAAVFSAEMSSADALLFMLSTSLSKDLYKRFVRPQASDRQVLRIARWAAFVGGVLAVGLAILLPSVIDSLTVFYSLLSVSLFVPVLAGLHSRRPGVPEAIAAIAGGIAVLVTVRLSPWQLPLNSTAWGLLASGILFGLVFLLRRGQRHAR